MDDAEDIPTVQKTQAQIEAKIKGKHIATETRR